MDSLVTYHVEHRHHIGYRRLGKDATFSVDLKVHMDSLQRMKGRMSKTPRLGTWLAEPPNL